MIVYYPNKYKEKKTKSSLPGTPNNQGIFEKYDVQIISLISKPK